MFEQVRLLYDFSALEPHIDTATMEVHYTGHHAAYTKALNDLVEKVPELKGKTSEEIMMLLDEVPDAYQVAVRNNCGGFINHNMYFESLSPNGGREAKGPLGQQIEKDFGGMEPLVEALKKAALTQFGSGYAWLAYCQIEQKLIVTQTDNQKTPMTDGMTKALLPIDVWEHAYYLKYRNKRADHVNAIFNVIDWDVVARRFENIRQWSVQGL